MDPATLAILLHSLIPIVACLSVFGMPVGLYWVSKSHKVRMRELEIDAQRAPPGVEQRLQSMEQRLAGLEQALTGSSRGALPSAQERAAMLEGPPDPSRLRSR
jgi:hypothetical protein